jgi:Mrp family chromosome partitioning ATPase
VKERERTLDSYVAQRHNRTQLLATHLERIVDQLEKQLASLPEVERTLALLERDVSVYVQLYAELLLRQQRAGILKASTLSKNRIVDWPEPVIKPATGGLRALSAATLAFGLLLGLHWVLWRRLVSSKACSLSLIERGLSGVPIWATIPAGEQSRHGPVPPRPHSEIVEGFRLLGAQLRCAATGAPPKPGSAAKREAVVLVTSPGPGDGKTTCALGLATTLARDHRDVLLIDANLLAPSLHRRLGLALSPGLTDVIAGRLHLEQAVREVCLSVVPRQAAQVDCLCAGVTPDNPAELWSRPELKRLLAEARLLYDFVVLDAPSVPPASDALSLARYVDRVLTVVRLGTTSRRLLAAHRAALEECAPPIAASVNECHPHVRRPPVPLVAPCADLQTS